MKDTVHPRAVPADCAPSLQIWLPCAEVRDFFSWVCRFLTDKRENILVPDGPGGSILIFDPPGSITGAGVEHVSFDDALTNWNSMLHQAAHAGMAFRIEAKDGTGAVLTRWDGIPG